MLLSRAEWGKRATWLLTAGWPSHSLLLRGGCFFSFFFQKATQEWLHTCRLWGLLWRKLNNECTHLYLYKNWITMIAQYWPVLVSDWHDYRSACIIIDLWPRWSDGKGTDYLLGSHGITPGINVNGKAHDLAFAPVQLRFQLQGRVVEETAPVVIQAPDTCSLK